AAENAAGQRQRDGLGLEIDVGGVGRSEAVVLAERIVHADQRGAGAQQPEAAEINRERAHHRAEHAAHRAQLETGAPPDRAHQQRGGDGRNHRAQHVARKRYGRERRIRRERKAGEPRDRDHRGAGGLQRSLAAREHQYVAALRIHYLDVKEIFLSGLYSSRNGAAAVGVAPFRCAIIVPTIPLELPMMQSMIERALSEEQRMMRNSIRAFVDKEVIPFIRKNWEKEWDMKPENRPSLELLEGAQKIGVRGLGIPEEFGGTPVDPAAEVQTFAMVAEEIARGDCGLADKLVQIWKISKLLTNIAPRHLQEKWFPRIVEDPSFLLAHCLTEPRGASDRWLPYDVPEAMMHTR